MHMTAGRINTAYFKNISTYVCGLLKSLFSKAIMGYRARVFLSDASKMQLPEKLKLKGLKCVALDIKCNCCSLKFNSTRF